MCNLYNITPAHEAMLGLFPKFGDVANRVGPQMDIFPDYPAPVLRNIRIGEPELALLRWAMPTPLAKLKSEVDPVWQPWSQSTVTGTGIDCGHHMTEEAPEAPVTELISFFKDEQNHLS